MNATKPATPVAAAVEPPLLAGLMRAELIDSAKQLQGVFTELTALRAEGLMPSTLAGKSVFNEAARMTEALVEKMELLTCLAETYSGQHDSNQDRLFLHTLLTDIIGAKAGTASARFAVQESGAEVAPVYGNKRWLRLLLAHLLRELDAGTNPAEKIIFTLRQLGNHMLLVSRTEAVAAGKRHQGKLPLPADGGLTNSLCQRIAELHGGGLHLLSEEEGGKALLTGFTLSLPTSVNGLMETFRCSECSLTGQIERYAADLALLADRCQQLEEERTSNGKAADR
ncbi:MAG: ATP-binding protein [Proteobacteria bacterium]|nr:ATP-binding protein [Pseudomonadota bacterium]